MYINHESSLHHPAILEILGTPYDYENGPDKVDYFEPGVTKVNCVFVAHLLIDRLCGVRLPPKLDPVHMILENQYLQFLEKSEMLQPGDIYFFGPDGIDEFRPIPPEIMHDITQVKRFKKQFPGPHVAVYIENNLSGEAMFIHGNIKDRMVSVWPVSKFLDYPRYQKIYARKRPIR